MIQYGAKAGLQERAGHSICMYFVSHMVQEGDVWPLQPVYDITRSDRLQEGEIRLVPRMDIYCERSGAGGGSLASTARRI